MIKNIIFDLGNVLLKFDPRKYLETKIPVEKINMLYKIIFQSKEWALLDRGTITEEKAIANIISRNVELKEYITIIFENWYDILEPIEKNVKILELLKKHGYKIYYLSNFHDLAFKYVTKKYDFFHNFDGGVVSYEEKMLKPEDEIYKQIIKKYELEPSECIFIDDTKENIDGAIKNGLHGIHLKDFETLEEELRKYNVEL
ncbi:MAG: HAD family phosphatase [Clostridium butyricum]|nr:HAD family phosphatase [Clostridium butyricum]